MELGGISEVAEGGVVILSAVSVLINTLTD